LHGEIFSLRNDVKPQQTAAWLRQLDSIDLVQVYTVGEKEYVQVSRWRERTRSENSKFPEPPQRNPAESCGILPPKPSPLAISHKPSPEAISHKSQPCGLEELLDFCKSEGIKQSDGEYFFHAKEGNGWRNGRNPMRDWKSTLRSWNKGKFLPSQKHFDNGQHSMKPKEPAPKGAAYRTYDPYAPPI
jgi:hypothetical protein